MIRSLLLKILRLIDTDILVESLLTKRLSNDNEETLFSYLTDIRFLDNSDDDYILREDAGEIYIDNLSDEYKVKLFKEVINKYSLEELEQRLK